jgi:hypothetical protein
VAIRFGQLQLSSRRERKPRTWLVDALRGDILGLELHSIGVVSRGLCRTTCSLLCAAWLLAACNSTREEPSSTPETEDAGVVQSSEQGKEIQCGKRVCMSPALCFAVAGAARCVCPLGYRDTTGDGSKCEDIDECLIPNLCDRNGTCENVEGSYRCSCAGPALVLRGNRCVCGSGYTRSTEGLCLAADGRECTDNLDCLNNHCESGICCAHSCDHPGECHTSEGATCKDGKTCEYPLAKDGTVCDDAKACTVNSTCHEGTCSGGRPQHCDDGNPCTDDTCEEPLGCQTKNNEATCDDHDMCTSDDRCSHGYCTGAAASCGAQDDVCNKGSCDPQTGQCKKVPIPDGSACDDTDSCTARDRCAAGSCSVHESACGPHASACSTGAPNRCTCESGFVDNGQGRCAPMNDECTSQNPCSKDADCDDPSNTAGDVMCHCKPGFQGDGVSCTSIDPCKDNPCGEGRGSCQPAGADKPGEYACSCQAGYVARSGTCLCDLSGTFAAVASMELAWDRMSNAIEPGSDTVYSYGIERHSYDDQGNLKIELTSCGDSQLDFCGVGVPPMVAAEAYSQFTPVQAWELPSMPKVLTTTSQLKALPGGIFETPSVANLRGVALNDPLGAWPRSYRDIAGAPGYDGSAVNGAVWLDQDADGFAGMTSYVVPPGGWQAESKAPSPPRTYGATSPICPRTGGPHTQYAYWPAPAEGLTSVPIRMKRFYTASRVISSFKGAVMSCDEIAGDVLGRNGDTVELEARVGGCVRALNDGETACSDAAVDFIDAAAQSETVVNTHFKLKRWPSDLPVSCSAARSFDFD